MRYLCTRRASRTRRWRIAGAICLGFVQAVFQTDATIETLLRTTTSPAGLDLYFYSPTIGRTTSGADLFSWLALPRDPIEPLPRDAIFGGPHWTGVLDIGDARWTMIAVPIPGGPGIPVSYRRVDGR